MKTGEYSSNKVFLEGAIEEEPVLDHSCKTESFDRVIVRVTRNSGNYDLVPVIISEKLLWGVHPKKGDRISIFGQLRSYSKFLGVEENGMTKSKLDVFVFAQGVDWPTTFEKDVNRIEIEGYLGKVKPIRKTPLGKEICDILLAVNRGQKSSYIPMIAWSRNAHFVEALGVGVKVYVEGRFQSRVYTKYEGDEAKELTAYEISISKIDAEENHRKEEKHNECN